jgi:hypothetical protein
MFSKETEKTMKKLDDLCFEKVLERDGHECIICKLLGKMHTSILQPHHVFSRKYKHIRWDLRNIYPVCKNHHIYAIHIAKALTEHLFQALIAAMYPERFEYISREKAVFFDVNMKPLLRIKRELENTTFGG